MVRFAAILLVLLPSLSVAAALSDFASQVQAAGEKIAGVIPACTEKMNAGDFAGANAVLLATFPEATRTPAESFILGNVLFDTDRRLSHELHQSAVKAEPENPDVVWEWALEQHRAGDYAGAASYQKVSAGNPRAATLYALEADCLLRLNRIEDAVAAWKKSEDAPDGSIESMEDLVCAVHREVAPHKLRADLLAKAVVRHDIAAAEDLIALTETSRRTGGTAVPSRHISRTTVPPWWRHSTCRPTTCDIGRSNVRWSASAANEMRRRSDRVSRSTDC